MAKTIDRNAPRTPGEKPAPAGFTRVQAKAPRTVLVPTVGKPTPVRRLTSVATGDRVAGQKVAGVKR